MLVLVRTFWNEGKVDEAVRIVRDMEQRGIKGSASVYYELACCLCNKGRWQEAVMEIEKLKKLRLTKPLAVTFTGMIMSSMDGGYVDDCISIFEQMLDHCPPNIGTVNAMLKVYGRNDMFLEVKELVEKVKAGYKAFLGDGDTPLIPDFYTYGAVLEASVYAHQWEYFEYVYKEMCFSGYQFDQEKHAVLLVEASKAGKWHLLEHAFETTLEAGKIPHPMLFSEMVCQAMLQDDYEKAARLVNSMAHAPFQINEKDWTDLFRKNKDRISDEHLKKLSTTLSECNLSSESTASELVKALHSICGSASAESTSCSDSYAAKGTCVNGRIAYYTGGHQKLLNDDFYQDKITVGQSSYGKPGMNELHAVSSGDGSDEDDKAILSSKSSSFVDVASDKIACLGEGFLHVQSHSQDTFEEMLTFDDWDSKASDIDHPRLPSADEILQSWKINQEKVWN
ncbi:pentatricopeptide repeat-containing protein At5g67570, chloroplastic-like [Chenopodium quinoa]|uniref:pentatricopeptide repeat-containing protein At5g67570, chloroplastic-like n=1 Tax=Chenopodium quinoa TaxID=63459 RepID=UPI000B7988E1|nr:pentatricopeptide repeat-containing protein At5g67570, chloroplastic-like [Chenopodium quinoa]